MKINPLEWSEVHETTFPAEGVLLLRSSQPFALSVESYGVSVAVGPETAHRIPLPEASQVTIVGGAAKVYRKSPPSRVVHMTGEKFTNIDRLPTESGTMLEVTKALRMLKLEERAMVRRIREERDLALAATKAKQAEVSEVIEPDPDPEPDPKEPDPKEPAK